MGSHSAEPSATPQTRRRMREVERSTDPTPEISGSVRAATSEPVSRYVSRPTAEPAVATPVRPMVVQPSVAPRTPASTDARPESTPPGHSTPADPTTRPTGRRAARAATSSAPAPSVEARPVAVPAKQPVDDGSTPSRRAARQAPTAEASSSPVRRVRPRAQSTVAIPVLPDHVSPSATAPVLEPAPRPTSVLVRASPAAAPAEPAAVRPVPAWTAAAPAPGIAAEVPAAAASAVHSAPVIEHEPELVVEPVTAVAPEAVPHQPARAIRTARASESTATISAPEAKPWELADTGEVALTPRPESASHDNVPHGTSRKRAGRSTRLVARLGVLGVLAAVTVAVPVTQGIVPDSVAFGSDALADSTLPSTVTALAGSDLSALPPASLVSADGSRAAREVASASRSDARSALPGCEGTVQSAGLNGQLTAANLCTLWDNHTQLRIDAAQSLAEFSQAFAAQFGADLCLSSGYRTLAQQRVLKATKGGLAAAPGKSNHGWGLAVDLCSDQTSGAKWTWLNENGPAYGWVNPEWAKPGGSGPHEKWHWEFIKGVMADGEYYDG